MAISIDKALFTEVRFAGIDGPVAQSVEHRTENPSVGSSILPWPTIFQGAAICLRPLFLCPLTTLSGCNLLLKNAIKPVSGKSYSATQKKLFGDKLMKPATTCIC